MNSLFFFESPYADASALKSKMLSMFDQNNKILRNKKRSSDVSSELSLVHEKSEAGDAPHFTRIEYLSLSISKPSGNMVKIKCPAAGK